MPQQQPPPETGRIILILIFLFFFYSSPDQNSPAFGSVHDYAAERVQRTRHALDILNTTKWQDFSPRSRASSPGESNRYLNLTGFAKGDDYAWERLDTFKERVEDFGKDAKSRWHMGGNGKIGLEGAVYENVTGIVKGKWVRYTRDILGEQRKRHLNLTEISPGIEWAYRTEDMWTRNITGAEGNLLLNIKAVESEDTPNLEMDLGPMDFVRSVDATLTIQDETSSGDGWDLRLHGVHWPSQGVIYMATTSEKFAGIFGLPHLTSDIEHYATSQKHLNRTLEKRIEEMASVLWRDIRNPWSATPDSPGDATNPAPHCEVVLFAQVQPISAGAPNDAALENVVEQIEMELRYPNGAPIPLPPRLSMSTVIFSPDCGFILESKGPPEYSPVDGQHLVGQKQEAYLGQVHRWMNLLALILFAQVLLLKIQSKEASTPSTVGRVSLYTMGIMLMADSLMFSVMSLLGTLSANLFPSNILVSFGALMSVGLSVKLLAAVYNVQEPERREREQARDAARAANAPPQPTPTPAPAIGAIITAAGVDTVTAAPTPPSTTNPPPVIVPSDQDFDAEFENELTNRINAAVAANAAVPLPTTNTTPTAQTANARPGFGAVYARFVFTISAILFLSLSANSWSVSWRSGYVNLLSFLYLSFWIPQIHRNIVRNCRKALLWKFIIGQSILRLLPIAYFYLKEDNVLLVQNDWKAFSVLAGWVWIQVWILVAQEVLGPRWGLPKHWYSAGWDYHPILREDNVEAGGLPIGLVRAPSSPTFERAQTGDSEIGSNKKKDSNVRAVDCAICMQVLEVPVVAAGEDVGVTGAAGGVAGMLARRLYMVTPCRHVFHSACLEGWMRHRLQCPICRETLPPL